MKSKNGAAATAGDAVGACSAAATAGDVIAYGIWGIAGFGPGRARDLLAAATASGGEAGVVEAEDGFDAKAINHRS